MAMITNAGVTTLSLGEYRALLEERYRGKFGGNIALADETPFGQLIGIQALALAEIDEQIAHLVNGVSVSSAKARQMDDLGTLLAIRRGGATHSTVTLALAGVSGTVVPSGSRARSQAGDEFETLEEVILPADSRTIDVLAQAVETGPIEAQEQTIRTIATLITGWETVTNEIAAIPGVDQTPDSRYRQHYRDRTARLATAPLDALRAGLDEAGVLRHRIEENYTNEAVTRQAHTLKPHSILCVCYGGEDQAIADAILKHKGVGVDMSGTTTVGNVSFVRIEEIPIAIALTTTGLANFPGDGFARIRRNLVEYGRGEWMSAPNDFYTEGFQIGEIIDVNRLYSPINAVPGHRASSLSVTLQNGNALPASIELDQIYTLDATDVTITIE